MDMADDIPYDFLSVMHYGKYGFAKKDENVRKIFDHLIGHKDRVFK